MFWHLLKKEIVHHILSFRFLVTAILFLILIPLSVFIMRRDYEKAYDEYRANLSAHQEIIEKLKEKNPNQMFWDLTAIYGLYGDRKPSPFRILVKGLDDAYPKTTQAKMGMTVAGGTKERLYQRRFFNLTFSPDLLFLVSVIFSLLALLFSFDTICGEKENGTLRLVLSNPVPRDLVILAKCLGGYILLLGPFLLSVILTLLYLSTRLPFPLTSENLARVGLIVLASSLYLALFFILGVLISVFSQRSSTALLVSCSVWLIWILIIPTLAPAVSRIFVPLPSSQKVEAEKAAINKEIKLRWRALKRYHVPYGKEFQLKEQNLLSEARRRRERLDKFYQNKLKAQIGLATLLARLSPTSNLTLVTTNLANTGIATYREFWPAESKFRKDFQAFCDKYKPDAARWRLKKGWLKLEELPQLKLRQPALNESFTRVLFDFLLLCIYGVLFFLVAFIKFLRADVR
jgi:ABC-type transport system involved in multi-copper enzyme maturation permease subunit